MSRLYSSGERSFLRCEQPQHHVFFSSSIYSYLIVSRIPLGGIFEYIPPEGICQAKMRMFLTAGARDLLDSAGYQNVKGGWPVQASDRIEAVLEAVGLRG